MQRHLAFNSFEKPGADPVSIPPRLTPTAKSQEVQPASSSPEEQNLVELKQWWDANRFPARVLERLIASDIGVEDVLDLACLGDEELQKAGMTPVQLKRFAVLQHKMNGVNAPPTIPQLAQHLEDIKRGFTAGKFDRAEAEHLAKGVTGDLARLTGTDPAGLFGMFVARMDPKPAEPLPQVPQVVSFTPPGAVTIKVSRPGESDQYFQTDSSGNLDVTNFRSDCSLQPMTQTTPPIPVGSSLQLVLPLTAQKIVDLPATSVQSTFQCDNKPLPNCPITGKFIEAGSRTTVDISTTTDGSGTLNIVLPPGRISDLIVRREDGEEVAQSSSAEVPAHNPDVPPEPLQFVFSKKSSKIPFLNYCRGDHVVFLGDVSGSMNQDGNGRESRIDVLKRTLVNAIDDVLEPSSTKKISLCAWSDDTQWFQSAAWLSAADKASAKTWVQALDANGQTVMGTAITEAVQLKQVSDIVTLCDGEFSDFNFDAIARSHPEIRFHFVAIGDQAATEQMQRMASSGNRGFFQHERSGAAA